MPRSPAAAPTAAEPPPLSAVVRAEQARILYRQAPAGFVINVLLGGLLVFVVSKHQSTPPAIGWLCALVAATSLRLFLWLAYRRLSRRAPPTAQVAAQWGDWFFAAMLCTSLVWGAGSVVLVSPSALTLQLGVTATVVCLAAGIAATTVANVKAIYVIVAVGAPYAIVFGSQGTVVHGLIALLIVVCSVGTSVLARNNARMFTEVIALRQEVIVQRDAAEQANLAKSKFLAAASHDLRQPLHAMTLFVDALDGRLTEPDDQRTLAGLQDSMGAMRGLFDALLDISRLDAGTVAPQVRDLDLHPLWVRLEREFEAQARQQHLTWRCAPSPVVVRTDPALLETILRNLLTNAFRYTRQGFVALTCSEVAGTVTIAVEDSGIGIAPDHQREIFREFFQVGNQARDPERGLGLGLAIVDRLTRLLEHRLTLHSTPGEGSCFALTLPAGSRIAAEAAETAGAPADSADPRAELDGLTVLVIDDQPPSRLGLQSLLRRWGCAVLLAESEDTALEALRGATRPPDVIIADYRLGDDRTGPQAIARVRQASARPIAALILTGDTSPERLREASGAGDPVLHKPVQPARLRALLRQARRRPPVV